jgi:hypothetical protein
VRHMIRHIVKLGHYQAFLDAMVDWNVEAQRLGLPAYRIWESQFGVVQEVWTEAEYESIDAQSRAFEGAHQDRAFAAANERLSTHLVDGSLIDYVLYEYGAPQTGQG